MFNKIVTMKKYLFLFAFATAGLFAFAQNTAKDVFTKDQIVWFGLDFSKAKMIGAFDQGAGAAPATGSDIKTKYVPGWNRIILNEPDKYDLKKTFRKTEVFKDLSVVEASNSRIDPDNFLTYNDYKFDIPNAVIEGILNSYTKGEKTEGIGLVFIVEYFNKADEKASYYVTFFDIATKKILFTQHMTGKAGGIGLRNYWIKTVKDVLDQVDSGAYKSWKNSYGQ
jgi:hypothetical protein